MAKRPARSSSSRVPVTAAARGALPRRTTPPVNKTPVQMDLEVEMFSDQPPSTRPSRLQGQFGTTKGLTAAQLRMQGRRLTDEELDALGEGDEGDEGSTDDDDEPVHIEDDGAVTPIGDGKDSPLRIHDAIRIEAAKIAGEMFEEWKKGHDRQKTDSRATLPMAVKTAAPVVEPSLTFRRVTVGDIDRLWDWIRQDGDRGRSFLGSEIESSLVLHKILGQLDTAEHSGAAMIRAAYWEAHNDELHIGFVALAPMFAAEKLALVHTYLAPDYRGEAVKIAPAIIALVEAAAPGFKQCVYSPTPALERWHRTVLLPLGFQAHTMFVR